jgi:inosose dehydratase
VAEAEFILARADRNIMLLGPDTGHLSWAGADLVPFLKRHADRIGGVHIKDYRKPVADRITAERKSYREAGAAGIWTEPGRGSIDLDAALAAIAGFNDWFVVEVDIADQPTVEDTARIAAQWLRPRLQARQAS